MAQGINKNHLDFLGICMQINLSTKIRLLKIKNNNNKKRGRGLLSNCQNKNGLHVHTQREKRMISSFFKAREVSYLLLKSAWKHLNWLGPLGTHRTCLIISTLQSDVFTPRPWRSNSPFSSNYSSYFRCKISCDTVKFSPGFSWKLLILEVTFAWCFLDFTHFTRRYPEITNLILFKSSI